MSVSPSPLTTFMSPAERTYLSPSSSRSYVHASGGAGGAGGAGATTYIDAIAGAAGAGRAGGAGGASGHSSPQYGSACTLGSIARDTAATARTATTRRSFITPPRRFGRR